VPRLYLDSSAITKRYSREAGTAGVVEAYRSAYAGRSILCFSEWNIGEVLGVLQRKARLASRPRAYVTQKGRLHGEIATLTRLRSLEVAAVGSRLLRESWSVSERHFLYEADGLQIVTAQAMRCDYLLSGDGDLREAARAEGLHTLDPAADGLRIRQLV
jgi:uncharacterized protein